MSRSTSNRKKHRDDFVNELRINISLILSAARKRNGWTQGELSDHTENVVCQEPISNYATGVSSNGGLIVTRTTVKGILVHIT